MKKSTIWILIIVMSVTLLGLLFMQIMYIEKMVKMRNDHFRELVTLSLYNVASNLERDETKHFLDTHLDNSQSKIMNIGGGQFSGDIDFGRASSFGAASGSRFGGDSGLSSNFGVDRSRQEILKNEYLYQKALLNEVILNILEHASDRPIAERADSSKVSFYIDLELQRNGLKMPFEFAIVNRSATIEYCTSGYEQNMKNEDNVYSQILFPKTKDSNVTLNVVFPTKSDYVFSSVKFMLPSLAFILLLMALFVFTVILI